MDLRITIDSGRSVSALASVPSSPKVCFVLAHGAGAGMRHPFMTAVASELAELNIATLRYQFPYMEAGSRRPDPPALCHAAVRAAVDEAARLTPGLPLIAGGRSFGGRMTSQAQAQTPLPGVRGLAFLGFPLHPAGKPSMDRAKHLADVRIPMLFLQGTRDALAELERVEQLTSQLGERATLKLLPDADHSWHVPARTGRKDPQVRAEALRLLADWIDSVALPSR
ncbi:MAG TPA: alpha/beta family hydrolase [Steroidobacteraceae bacterium]